LPVVSDSVRCQSLAPLSIFSILNIGPTRWKRIRDSRVLLGAAETALSDPTEGV
jgi:hypothetical protein